MYDFHKSKKKGSTEQYFEHPLFQRAHYEKLRDIKRKSNKDHPNQNESINSITLNHTNPGAGIPFEFLG